MTATCSCAGCCPADIAALQRQIGAIAREAGWLRPDAPVDAAVADPSGFCVDPDPTYLTTLRTDQSAGGLSRAEAPPGPDGPVRADAGRADPAASAGADAQHLPGARGIHHQGAPGLSQRAGHHRGIYRLDAADRLPDGGRPAAGRRRHRTPAKSTTSTSPPAPAASRSPTRSKDAGSLARSSWATCWSSTA